MKPRVVFCSSDFFPDSSQAYGMAVAFYSIAAHLQPTVYQSIHLGVAFRIAGTWQKLFDASDMRESLGSRFSKTSIFAL